MAAPMTKLSFLRDILNLQRKSAYSRYLCISRHLSTTQNANSDNVSSSTVAFTEKKNSVPTPTASDRLGHVMQMYEDLVGLTEVKTAQDNVVDAERNFLKVQEDRRTLQQEISEIQTEVRCIATELEKTHRTDPKYIDLIKKEHGVLVKEKDMTTKLRTLDRTERDLFSLLSMYVRESHEKERARAERTKYWSVIGSIVGAVIGITGSTINNHRRLKELRSIVKESGENSAEYKDIVDKVLASISSYSVANDVSGDSDSNSNNNNKLSNEPYWSDTFKSEMLQQLTDTFDAHLNLRNTEIMSNLIDIQKMVAVSHSSDGNSNIVYVGPEMKSMLQETQLKVEQNSNKNLAVSLSVMSVVFTVGLSLMAFIFRGSS